MLIDDEEGGGQGTTHNKTETTSTGGVDHDPSDKDQGSWILYIVLSRRPLVIGGLNCSTQFPLHFWDVADIYFPRCTFHMCAW